MLDLLGPYLLPARLSAPYKNYILFDKACSWRNIGYLEFVHRYYADFMIEDITLP